MDRKNILILDPERDVSELFARALETRKDCKCYMAVREEEVLDLLKDIAFDLVLMDMSTAMSNDFSLVKRIKRLSPDTVIIIDAYLHQREQARHALHHGARDYFFKPIKVEELRKKIHGYFDSLFQSPSNPSS